MMNRVEVRDNNYHLKLVPANIFGLGCDQYCQIDHMTSDKTKDKMKEMKEDLNLIKDKNDMCETYSETLIQKSEDLMQRHL